MKLTQFNKELAARRFTSSAIHIVEQLSPRAADRSASADMTDHTVVMLALWSLLRWERKVGLVALEQMGIDTNALAVDVDKSLEKACAGIREQNGPPKSQRLPSGRLVNVVDFDARLAPLLTAAEHEALGLGHNWVGTEHLLLAIVRLADLRLRKDLERHHARYDELRQSVLEILQASVGGNANERTR